MTPSMAWLSRPALGHLPAARPPRARHPAAGAAGDRRGDRPPRRARRRTSEWTRAGIDEFLRAYLTPRGRVAFYAAARQIYLEEPGRAERLLDRGSRSSQGDSLFIWGRRDTLVPIGFERHVREGAARTRGTRDRRLRPRPAARAPGPDARRDRRASCAGPAPSARSPRASRRSRAGPRRARAGLTAAPQRPRAARRIADHHPRPLAQVVLVEGLRGQPDRPVGDGRLQPAAVAVPAGAARAVHRRPGARVGRPRAERPRGPPAPLPDRRRGDARTRALDNVRNSSTGIGIVALVASIWIGSSFWGALDTAFCRIYHVRCRSWLEQKRFALRHAARGPRCSWRRPCSCRPPSRCSSRAPHDLPLGLSEVARAGLLADAGRRPAASCSWSCASSTGRCRTGCVPWRAVWPGALGATFAMALIDWAFPAYLTSISTIAQRRHDVRLRPDRADLVLRAGDHHAGRRGDERAALRAARERARCRPPAGLAERLTRQLARGRASPPAAAPAASAALQRALRPAPSGRAPAAT